MSIYNALIILISLSAAFAYINQRFLKLPFVIGLFVVSTVLSVFVLSARFWLNLPYDELKTAVENAKINSIILDILLGFLLFAGALHTNWQEIKKQIKAITIFALFGVLLSTFIISILFYGVCQLFDIQIDFVYCLLFGALISPTDPIAVLGILTKANVPKKIESTIVGESLFNDGVGVVLFISILQILNSKGGEFHFSDFGFLFIQEAIGGILVGIIFGYILHYFLKKIDHYETEVLLTLAFVMVGYSLFNFVHISGALAMVVMGLMVGNYKTEEAMSDITQEYIGKFWELVDVILNSVLFIIIAFVILMIDFETKYIYIGVVSIFIVLLSRIIIVYFPKFAFPKIVNFDRMESRILIWGGLRGGLSIALVLSLPESEQKNLLLIATYLCVLFSIIIQGLTIGKLAKNV